MAATRFTLGLGLYITDQETEVTFLFASSPVTWGRQRSLNHFHRVLDILAAPKCNKFAFLNILSCGSFAISSSLSFHWVSLVQNDVPFFELTSWSWTCPMKYSHSRNLMCLNITFTDFYEAKILDDRSITTDKSRTKIPPRHKVNVFTQYITSLKKLAGTRFCALYCPFKWCLIDLGFTWVSFNRFCYVIKVQFKLKQMRNQNMIQSCSEEV